MTDDFRAAFHGSVAVPQDHLVALIEQELRAQVTGLERVIRGYANEVYVADLAASERVVVRIRRRGSTSFASEAWAMETARRAGVPIPEVYAVTVLEAGEPLEVMLLSLVPGRPLGDVWPNLKEAERRNVVYRVAQTLRAMHAEVGGWGRRSDDGVWEFSTWQARGEAEVQDREADVPTLQEAGLTEAETDGLMDAVRAMLAVKGSPPVLCHGDLGVDHVFVDESLHVTGVIDFGMWRGGPSELDAAVLTMYHPDVPLSWLGPDYERAEAQRRVLSERLAVGMGFLAHDLRAGSADYLEFALAGLRGSLQAWRAL